MYIVADFGVCQTVVFNAIVLGAAAVGAIGLEAVSAETVERPLPILAHLRKNITRAIIALINVNTPRGVSRVRLKTRSTSTTVLDSSWLILSPVTLSLRLARK